MGIFDFFKKMFSGNREEEMTGPFVQNEDGEEFFVLEDEDGNPVYFEFLDSFGYQGNEYVVLLPTDVEDEDDGEVVILGIEGNEDGYCEYVNVDDDELLQKVFDIFKERNEEFFNFQ